MRPFASLKEQATEHLLQHPADQWRLRTGMRTNAMSGMVEDDMTKFFIGRSPFEVSDADIWRWRACCEALRQLDKDRR